jgi:aspartyl-tRNA(Asn)/glutamyl-tRNA(Gln) amidotransferase subunit A
MSARAALDATELLERLRAGELGARESIEAAFERIERHDGALGAFLETSRGEALARADELDRSRARGGEVGPLFGVPVALKSNMCLEGREASCGSRILAGYRPPYTATFVQRLLDAGAVPVGMTNMDEFAMGSSGENSAFVPARNPWDLERTPGGSSSGSAAAVCASLVPLALGSDTGGSVRQPAALCGISGFKPTYGRVSRYGLIAFGSSLDQVSPLARSVRDLELVMSVISGVDPLDSTCQPLPPLEPLAPRQDLRGMRIGVPVEYFPDTLDRAVRARVEEATLELARLGAEPVEVRLPHTEHGIPTYYVVATAEASSNLARYDGVRYGLRVEVDGTLQGMFAATREKGFGAEVKRRILLGTYVLSSGYYDAWYSHALKVRALLLRDFEQAFETVDAIVCPTSPTPAFRLGEKTEDPVAMYLSDVMTVPTSLAGLPAVSVPCGFVPGGAGELPVGMQIIGPAMADAAVLAMARAYQEATAHHRRLPPLALEEARA